MPGFSVAGSGGNGPSNLIETYRVHRWYIESIGPLSPFAAYAKKFGRPVMEVDRIVMNHGQDEIYMAGKNRWLPIEATFYEVDGVAAALHRWAGSKVINIRASITSAAPAYKMDCQMAMLDGLGSIVYEYMMYGVWPSKVVPVVLDYASNDISEVTATLEMDKADEQ